MSSYEERAACLRPLVTRADVESIFPTNTLREHRSGELVGWKATYGQRPNNDPRSVDTHDIVEEIRIAAPFPSSFGFYGFFIGMPLPEAARSIADLGLHQTNARTGHTAFAGETPDGFGLRLSFDDALSEILLLQPNHEAIIEARRVFWGERAELKRKQWEESNAWKLITDDDDAKLDKWAVHCKPWNDYSPEEFVKFAAWLKSADPDERHMAAMYCNWDYGIAPLLWIVRQPDCDIATAAYIFFGCEPSYYLGPDGDAHRVRDASMGEPGGMMIEIKERMDRGFYSRSAIQFDASDWLDGLNRAKLDDTQLAAVLPDTMKSRYEGRQIDEYNHYAGLRMPALAIS
jgi:hypothetical protein